METKAAFFSKIWQDEVYTCLWLLLTETDREIFKLFRITCRALEKKRSQNL